MSILNSSKIYETFAKSLLISNIEEFFFSPFLAVYIKSYSTQYVLIIMVEEWKENWDNYFIVGAFLTDLSKAFDCIPNDLLMTKLSAYGLNSDSLCYIYSYLKDCKRCVQKIVNKASLQQSYQVYPKAQFSDQFYVIFFSATFCFLFQKLQFIILWIIII